MSKIGIRLVDGNIAEYADENSANAQLKLNKGWVLVDTDPTFSSAESYLWTIRESDNKLVHISTGLTPDEETQKSNTELTNMVIAQGTDIEQIKQSITALTNMQLSGVSTETSDK